MLLRRAAHALLAVSALACVAGGLAVGFAFSGNVRFGIMMALLAIGPMFALIALAGRFGLGREPVSRVDRGASPSLGREPQH